MFVIKSYYKCAEANILADGIPIIFNRCKVVDCDTYNVEMADNGIIVDVPSLDDILVLCKGSGVRKGENYEYDPLIQPDDFQFEFFGGVVHYLHRVIIENAKGKTVDIFDAAYLPDVLFIEEIKRRDFVGKEDFSDFSVGCFEEQEDGGLEDYK